MSGIRVSIFSHEHVSEKLLHSYFANPNNGGGKIASIHYPMFGGHTAVIVFEDEDSKHIVGSRLVYVFAVGNAILHKITRLRLSQICCCKGQTILVSGGVGKKCLRKVTPV